MIAQNLIKTGPKIKKTFVFVEEPVVGAKAERTEAVLRAVVTTASGKTFDADEKAQERMLRALKVAELTSATSTPWKLADDTFSDITKAELEEAFVLAAQKQQEIWINFG